jgi:hypothetical protein
MFPEWVLLILKENGVAGAIVFVLCSVVVALAYVVRSMYNQANKVYGYRLTERDTLTKALNDATAAINAMKVSADERNEVTDEMAISLKLLVQRIESNHLALKDEMIRTGASVTTAATVYAKTVDDIRATILAIGHRK